MHEEKSHTHHDYSWLTSETAKVRRRGEAAAAVAA